MMLWRQHWKMNPAALLLLGGMVILMLLIVALPDDLDLPDAAFHRGTAPVLVHSQATSAPATATLSPTLQLPAVADGIHSFRLPRIFSVDATPNFLPIFLRAIRT